MIPKAELNALKAFDSRGSITLSAYLSLDTPEHRDSAYDDFMRKMQARLDDCRPRPECREAIKEDMEIVGIYLKTNGHRGHAGLAIFSCASELFWRAYPLPVAPTVQVTVGPSFDVEPLMEVMGGK